ncbi:hypothetical protein ACQRBP_15950, partial [Eubacteriales bacterium SGI.150]
MKAKLKPHKLLSMLLALVMLLSLLPTTALAADYNEVKVNGVSLGDGEYLTSNAATAANSSSTKPSSYVAWYKDGTLTLNGYEGTGIVLQGAPAADLIIKLIGDNTITTTTHETGIQGNSAAGSITITADSGSNGNLTIDMTNSTRPVFGINGYANSVTITGSADVKITAVATATNQESYGIKSSKAVSILDSASVSITCKTPNSTSRSDSCNGIYSDTGVTINTGGTIQIDVHKAGDEAYSYGINSMGTLTLTKVGGMTVKWKKAGVQGAPLLPSSASFDPTAYDTHMDTMDTTNCTATYMPKGTTPTGNYPDASNVYVDGGKSFYNNRLYYKKGDQDKNFTGNEGDYIAHYNPATGTLTLNGYSGGSISVGGVKCSDITVVLKGTNTINGSLENAVGGDITVTSSDGGTLSISKTTSGGNAAIGIETGFSGSYTTGSVTIKGDAEVTIDMTHTGTSTYEKAYGIFAKENITISENASVDITCATPNNTTGGSNCNGMFAKGNVSIDTTGKIKIDVTKAGKDSAYSYGIYPMGTPTLTKVGEMQVQWKKHSTHSSYPGGAFTRGATFSDTDHAINVDTTNCYASYRFGTPYTVTVQNGKLTGPGVPNARVSGSFLQGDKVNITPATKKGRSGEEIPFKEWTSSDVTLDKSATTASNSFTVPGKDVTVTAMHNPFDGAPTFTPTGTTGTQGTLTFKTVVKADAAYEGFRLVEEGNENNESSYNLINPDTTSTSSPYEYSYETSIYSLNEGNYYVAELLDGTYYLSEKFTVNYTAAPTGNYPDSVTLYNGSGKIIGLSDGQYLAANGDTEASLGYTDGTSYVARYDKSTGTLYLKDYHGVGKEGGIAAASDLNIVVESDSSFTTSITASNNSLMGIQAEGKLKISGSGKLTVSANGNSKVYGIYAKEGVTISAPLDVTVKLNDSSKSTLMYGIYTKSGAISLSGEDKTITVTGGESSVYGVYNNAAKTSTSTVNGNIDIRGKLTVNLNNGKNNVGIRTVNGGTITLDDATVNIPSNFLFGIYNKENNNGNVVIRNGSNVTLASDITDGSGICADYGGDLRIENSTVSISAKGYAADLNKGKLSIKDSIVDLTRDYNHYRVVNTANDAANTIDLSGSGSVTLTASGEQTTAMIGGKVTATSGTKLEKGTYYPGLETYDGEYDGSSKTVLQFVHEDPAPGALGGSASISGTAKYDEVLTAVTTSITGNTGTFSYQWKRNGTDIT